MGISIHMIFFFLYKKDIEEGSWPGKNILGVFFRLKYFRTFVKYEVTFLLPKFEL